jgi:hypothetical protein
VTQGNLNKLEEFLPRKVQKETGKIFVTTKINSEERLRLQTKMFDLISDSDIKDGILPEDFKAS